MQKILTFSHVLGDAQLTRIDLRAAVDEGLHLFSALAPPSVEIRAEIGENIPAVKADATLAFDLVMNLCTNALQSMYAAKGVRSIGLRYPQHGYNATAA